MFKQPYPFLYTTKNNSVILVLISILVFLINFLINDDDIVKQHFYIDRLTFSIGFGLISGLFILIVLEVIPRLFFKEELKENWTLGKEALFISGLFILIIIGNYIFILFAVKNFHQAFQFKTFFIVVFQGIGIGFVPACIAVLIHYTIVLRRNLKEVTVYNQQLVKRLHVEIVPIDDVVFIPTDNKSETIRIVPSELRFVKSEGNYVELYLEIDHKVKKEVYRTSIKVIEDALHAYPKIIRTHRCYLANLQKVTKYTGNARNFQLYFDDSETMVPVSRNKFQEIRDCMNVS
jgi:DNA-binding LytR/AlgR family response regulator